MQLRTRSQAIWAVILITAAATAVSLILAAVVVPLTNFKPDWHHWFFATVFPLILTPIFCVPLVRANFRLVRMHAQLEKMAMTDSLTGLPNRRAFFRHAARIFSAAEETNLPVAVLMVDVDHLKTINDSYGHDVGDEVIDGVGNSIRQAVKVCDGRVKGFAGRIGGDEFAVVISGLETTSVSEVAGCIGEEVRRIGYVHAGDTLAVTVSIGVAMREPGEGIDAVLAAADQAAYDAKRNGRDRSSIAQSGHSSRQPARTSRVRDREAAA